MKDNIPYVDLPAPEKPFGFKIANNNEILSDETLGYNPFRPHRIQFYAILFILEGEGVHYVDFKKYTYKKGCIIFISKEQVHAFQRDDHRTAFFLLFSEEFLEKGGKGSNLLQQLSLYNYTLYPPVIQLKKHQTQFFLDLAEKIRKEFDAPDDQLTEEIMHASLKIFLCIAERIRKNNRAEIPKFKYHDEYLQLQKLLKQHIFQSRKVQFYADRLLISSKKLNRITQEIVQQNTKHHIHSFLILEIKRLLMNTSLSISEIAYKTGFDETTNFVKYFKKQTKLNPSQFRSQFQ